MKRFLRSKLVLSLTATFVLLLALVLSNAAHIPVGARAANDETLTALFVNGPNGATTTNSYTGNVTINVSGTGQAAGTAYSDAFYIFTDASGNPITPIHPADFHFSLCINDQSVNIYVPQTPPYSSNHSYQFTITVKGPQHLTFGICDTFTSDNTGSFTITVTGAVLPPPAAGCAPGGPESASAFRFPLDAGFGRYFTFKELYPSDFRIVAWRGTYHPGVDYYSTLNAPVYAVANGVVVRRQVDPPGYGSYVVIQHTLPDGEVVYSVYAHLSNFRPAPEVGCPVTEGQVIGYEGASGEGSGGIVHVHFELRLPSGFNPWNTFPYPVGGTDPLHNINNFLDPDSFIPAHAG